MSQALQKKPTIQSPLENSPAGAGAGASARTAQLRGLSLGEAAKSLSPAQGGAELDKQRAEKLAAAKPQVNLTAKQIKAAQTFNLQSHSVSMLSQIREFLVKGGYLTQGKVDKNERVDVAPTEIVDGAFVEAVAAYQQAKGAKAPDGQVGPATFAWFEKNGLEYTLRGGNKPTTVKGEDGKPKPRTVIPKNAPAAQVFDYFKEVILAQGGIFLEKEGFVNIVGIRGGKLGKDNTVSQTDNAFNQWNDTLVVLRVGKEGKKFVSFYEATTDPGVAKKDVATLPEGTHAMEMGTHKGYTALTPAFNQHTPVIRNGESFLGLESGRNGMRGGGLALNIHTTHGWNKGALAGPGAYSEGCAVINGQDAYKGFINQMSGAAKSKKNGGPGQTFIYYTVISAARLETFTVKQQKELAP
jgi:hypothetical protein